MEYLLFRFTGGKGGGKDRKGTKKREKEEQRKITFEQTQKKLYGLQYDRGKLLRPNLI